MIAYYPIREPGVLGETMPSKNPSPSQQIERLRLRGVRRENRFFLHFSLWAVASLSIISMVALVSEEPLTATPLIGTWGIAVMIHGFFALVARRARSTRQLVALEAEIRTRAAPSGSAADPEVAELRARLTRAAENAREVVHDGGGQAVADVARGESLGLSIVAWLEEARHLLRRGREIGELRHEVVNTLSRPGTEVERAELRQLLGKLDGRDVKLASLEREAARRHSVLDSFILLLDSAGLAGAKGDMLAAVTKPIRDRLSLLESVVESPAVAVAASAALGDPRDGRIEQHRS